MELLDQFGGDRSADPNAEPLADGQSHGDAQAHGHRHSGADLDRDADARDDSNTAPVPDRHGNTRKVRIGLRFGERIRLGLRE